MNADLSDIWENIFTKKLRSLLASIDGAATINNNG